MNITLVLAVLNNIELTRQCYNRIREIYPEVPLVITSGGSTDDTKDWLVSLSDDNLSYFHDDDHLSFSDNYNTGISMVDTDKLVLIHNDMVIGKYFLENIERQITEKNIVSYTTIEPPIFSQHKRPGKEIINLGYSFNDFDYHRFNEYVENNKNNTEITLGATFFMGGYKSTFEDIGLFDGFSFDPAFCEDDDFLIRASLKGYKLITIGNAFVYHFVSQTSRFSPEFKNVTSNYEKNSNRNFIRKWGIPSSVFNELRYWEESDFNYPTFSMGLITKNTKNLYDIEPYFDKIDLGGIPEDYIEMEQRYTKYDLRSKFVLLDPVDVIIHQIGEFTKQDYHTLTKLRLSIPHYEPGIYEIGNMSIEIIKVF